MTDPIVDELTPVAVYMAQEMNTNPRSQIGVKLRALNTSDKDCIAQYVAAPWWRQWVGLQPEDCARIGLTDHVLALILWGGMVKPKQPWDHKPKLKARTDLWSSATGRFDYHVYGSDAYFYDVWSNVHYGYVGRAVGFDRDVLLDGAGAAQWWSDLRSKRPNVWPKSTGPWWIPRSWDNPEDRVSVALGTELYRLHPLHINPAQLVRAIVQTTGLVTQPAAALMKQPGQVMAIP